ncbi:hypothetical protein NOR51B_421 [Luminiphilus syltensis NOR5-1B]|uniref:Uncharacterized protein n=1 Tax=Luminiphilus syltensis NOR5-1B TaxID=565045 RepID=B8KSH9_9GAMM|nr:hypothetical protein NOR51B_421 [Luminiphilus syltensis NOR5-1B]
MSAYDPKRTFIQATYSIIPRENGDQLAEKLKELALGVKTERVEKVTVEPEWFLSL